MKYFNKLFSKIKYITQNKNLLPIGTEIWIEYELTRNDSLFGPNSVFGSIKEHFMILEYYEECYKVQHFDIYGKESIVKYENIEEVNNIINGCKKVKYKKVIFPENIHNK